MVNRQADTAVEDSAMNYPHKFTKTPDSKQSRNWGMQDGRESNNAEDFKYLSRHYTCRGLQTPTCSPFMIAVGAEGSFYLNLPISCLEKGTPQLSVLGSENHSQNQLQDFDVLPIKS